MSDRLEVAAGELALVFRELEEIVRVDLDDSGMLVLTATGRGATRWFTHDDRGLIECFPERDTKLPLATSLAANRDARVLSYRPRKRMVVVMSRGERVNVFKGHRRSRSARAAVKQGIAEDAMRRGAFRVPRLLAHDGEHEALVFEYLPAREVELLESSAPAYGKLGEELRVFQGDPAAHDLDVFGASQELEVLERWREKVIAAVGALPPGWPEACARLARCAAGLPAPELGLAHRDLHDRQVHWVDGSVALLDFDLLCRADVALDPGNLIAHLRWRALQGLHGATESSVKACELALLAGLARAAQPGFSTRLSFYVASTALRLALVYRLRPRWSSRVERLVAMADGALDPLAPTH